MHLSLIKQVFIKLIDRIRNPLNDAFYSAIYSGSPQWHASHRMKSTTQLNFSLFVFISIVENVNLGVSAVSKKIEESMNSAILLGRIRALWCDHKQFHAEVDSLLRPSAISKNTMR